MPCSPDRGAVEPRGQFENLPVGRLHPPPLVLVPGIGGEHGVHVAVAGVSQYAQAQLMALCDLADTPDHFRDAAYRPRVASSTMQSGARRANTP